MDSLIKKDDLMLGGREPFAVQAHDQSHVVMANGYEYFAATEAAQLPMVRSYKTPAADVRSLTARETQIIELLGKGLSVKGVARDLAITPGTVKWHVKNIYYKLGASSREDALSKARQRQIIRL